MARWRERVRLEDGLKLDLRKLMRQGFAKPGEFRSGEICWLLIGSGDPTALGFLTMNLLGESIGSATIRLGRIDQRLDLRREARHFGGGQWYFICPATARRVSVLWLVPGASRFLSRQAFGRRVAYGSQFESRHDRALWQAQNIRYRLGGKKYLSVMDGLTPPKPKGMHWRTYDKLIARSERYEMQCLSYLSAFLGRLKRV